ncbi:MAG: dihydrofolate reductase [bacterium]|nr:dihydrofolate reductase [bacterium]
MISMISALAKNRAIGKRNALPWYLPADLKHFKEKTTGKTIVMGLNTFKSVGERPLPNRKNIVLTDDKNYQAPEDVVLAHSIEEVLEMTKNDGEVMISGGAMVYKQFFPLAERLYLTFIDHDFEGDIFFPEFNKGEWREVSREDHEPDEKNAYRYSFVVLERV